MMGAFFIYLVKATICLVIFSLFFRLLLMKETFFRFTRITLIAGLVLCSILPVVKIEVKHFGIMQQPIAQLERIVFLHEIAEEASLMKLDELTGKEEGDILAVTSGGMGLMKPDQIMEISGETGVVVPSGKESTVSENKMFSFMGMIFTLYLLGVLIMCVRLVVSLWRLQLLLRNNPVTEHDGYRLVICSENIIPFSFFNYIVISEEDYRINAKEIILHEQMHIRYRHNLDILFSELFLIIHWFNPAVWSLHNDLREVHEYEADNAVIEHGVNAREYQLLLVKKAVGERRFTSVVNSFNQSKIKNRIGMMLRKESSGWARLKILLIVPLTALLLLAFAQPERVEDQRVDHQSRKDAIDYFLSVRNLKKDNYLAYLYLNEEGELYLMKGNEDVVSLKAFDLQERAELIETFTDLISAAIDQASTVDIHFNVGAENDLEMAKVSFVKEVMRKAYNQSLGSVMRQHRSVEELRNSFPLKISYSSVQASSARSVVKLVQENPFFYWEEVQRFCNEKGIKFGDMEEIISGINRQQLVFMLINSRNDQMYRSHLSTEMIKREEERNGKDSQQSLKKIMKESMDANGPDPVYFIMQYDITSSTQFIFNFLESTLPAAYEGALSDISERDNIPIDRLRKEKPLLLLHAIPKNFGGTANAKSQQESNRKETFAINVSVIKEEKEQNSYFTAVSYGGEQDLQTVSLRYEIIPDKSGNDNIIQEQFTSILALEPADIALISTGSDVTKTDLNNIKEVVEKKLKVGKTIFVQRI